MWSFSHTKNSNIKIISGEINLHDERGLNILNRIEKRNEEIQCFK